MKGGTMGAFLRWVATALVDLLLRADRITLNDIDEVNALADQSESNVKQIRELFKKP